MFTPSTIFTVGSIVDKYIHSLYLPFLMPKDLQKTNLKAMVFLQTFIPPPDKSTCKRRKGKN